MTENKEELRPCPFCGKKPRETSDEFGFRIGCCSGVGIRPSDRDKCVDYWNSAWCWKEIDRLTLELKQSQAHREQMSREICEDGVKLEALKDGAE